MNLLRVLTSIAGFIVLGAMGVFVYRNDGFHHDSIELISPLVVVFSTLLLGVLTYDPTTLGSELRKLFSPAKERRQSIQRRIVAQLALYALVSGIILAIMQVLATQARAEQPLDLGLALWPLLYGVFLAIAFWIVAGPELSEKSTSHDGENTGTRSSDENQVILAFCVLLLTVGVLSLVFVEIYNQSPNPSSESRVSESAQTASPYGDLQLCEDMTYRSQSSGSPSVTVATAPAKDRASSTERNRTTGSGDSPEVALPMAPVRWELNLPGSVSDVLPETTIYQHAVNQQPSHPVAIP